MKRSDKIRKQIENTKAELAGLEEQLNVAKGDELFKCGQCDKSSKFNKLTLIKKYLYTKGYGYIDGEYNFSMYMVLCHKCNDFTDVWKHSNKDKVEMVKEHEGNFLECLEYMPHESYRGEVTLGYLREEQNKRRKYRGY